MAKSVGTIEIECAKHGKEPVEAFRIGKFWAINKSSETSSYYNVTHKATGQRLTHYSKYMRAYRLVGVLDVLMPVDEYAKISEIWFQLPKSIQEALK